MTTPSSPDRLADVLRIYAKDPLDDGDAVLFVDEPACPAFTGLADQWDEELRRSAVEPRGLR